MISSGDLLIFRGGTRHSAAVLTPGGNAVNYRPSQADPNGAGVVGTAGWTVNGVVKWPRFAAVQANAAAANWESGSYVASAFSGTATAATAGSLAVPIGGRDVIQLQTDGVEPCLSVLCAGTLVIKWIP